MRAWLFTVVVLTGVTLPVSPQQASESRIPVGRGSLYARTVGQGAPVIVLHGGPDFDHSYLLPEFDRFANTWRLIYYDQRGRGRSADGVQPSDVTLDSDLADIDAVRQHFKLAKPIILGHSWGAVLALEYALRHPDRVSQLVLMNPAPVSTAQVALLRKGYARQLGTDMDAQRTMLASAAYQAGEPDAVAARYRIHFKHALTQAADYEKLMARMKAGFIAQGKDGILKARAVEDQLMRDTWQRAGYDLLPKLRKLSVPTLVITGANDFIPVAISEEVAGAIPGARLVTVRDCGHFSYMECATEVRAALSQFLTVKPY
jgi:proline iminopeptidase